VIVIYYIGSPPLPLRVKQALLRVTGPSAERRGIKSLRETLREGFFHPDVHGEGVRPVEAEEQDAGRDLRTDADDAFELGLRVLIPFRRPDPHGIDPAGEDLFRGVREVFRPESAAEAV